MTPIRRGIHNTITGRNVDTPISWTFATAVIRLAAAGFKPIDVGRYAWQTDNDTIWMLKDDNPVTWAQVGGDPIYASQDGATIGDNLLTNGTFDSDLSGWTYQATPTGTVDTTGSDANVTGTGTNFLACFRDGDSITIEAETKTILRVISDTLITVTSNFGVHTGVAFSVVGGWEWDASGRAKHVAGNSVPLSQSITTLTASAYHFASIGITRSAGAIVQVNLSNSPGGLMAGATIGFTTTYEVQWLANAATQTFEIVPNSAFAGYIDNITLGLAVPNENPVLKVFGTDARPILELRGSPYYQSNDFRSLYLGYNAGRYAYSATRGYRNVAVGNNTLPVSGTGNDNVGIGINALNQNISGSTNMAIGSIALRSLLTGVGNMAVGSNALGLVTKGSYNVGIGQTAGIGLITGDHNLAIGYATLYDNFCGSNNLAFGNRSLFTDQGGDYNIAIGSYSLYNVKATVKAITASADYSATVPGTVKMTSASHGRSTGDVLILKGMKYYNGTYTITKIDNNNFYIDARYIRNDTGWWILSTQDGSKNIGIGYYAGGGITYGSGNVVIGNDITGLAAGTTNNIILGSGGVIRLRYDGTNWNFYDHISFLDKNFILGETTGTQIGTATSQKLGFYGKTPIVQPTALSAQLTGITHTSPSTPDYQIQDFTQSSPWGFADQDEANTVLSVILNLQTRVSELETKLQSLGLLA